MTRQRRTRVLVEGDPQLATALSSEIEKAHEVRLLSSPREILVMSKARETSAASLFYLGEVLATECRVAIDQSVGIGLVIGSDRVRSWQLAVIDAAFGCQPALPEQACWTSLLQAEEALIATRQEADRTRIAATRVEFDSMLTEEEQAALAPEFSAGARRMRPSDTGSPAALNILSAEEGA